MNETAGKENSVLEIFVPPFASKPAVRLQVNGANSCWLNMTPEQAFDTASAIWKAAATAIMGTQKPIIGLTPEGTVRIVPGQPMNKGITPLKELLLEASAPARPALPPAKPRQRNKRIKSQPGTSPGDQAPDKPA